MDERLQNLLDELGATIHRSEEKCRELHGFIEDRAAVDTFGGNTARTTEQTQIESTVKLDKAGLPWDARIHSAGAEEKRIKADGNWRLKRNVDPALVATVEAELRGAAPATTEVPIVASVVEDNAPPPPTTDAPPPAPAAPAAPEMRIVAGIAYTREALLTAGHDAALIDTYPLAEAAAPAMTYGTLIVKITTEGVAPEAVTAACVANGCPGIAELGGEPFKDAIPVVAAALGLS